MRRLTVFPQKHALPSAKEQAAIRKGNSFTRAGERHLDVTRHVIRTFKSVGEIWIIFRHQAVQPLLQIIPRRGVRIFHDDETATRVLAKHRNDTLLQPAGINYLSDLVGYLSHRLASGSQGQGVLVNRHDFIEPSSFRTDKSGSVVSRHARWIQSAIQNRFIQQSSSQNNLTERLTRLKRLFGHTGGGIIAD